MGDAKELLMRLPVELVGEIRTWLQDERWGACTLVL